MSSPAPGIRFRFLIWLLAIVVPAIIAAWVAMSVIEKRLAEEIADNLVNARRLEAARITNALDNYENQAIQLASGLHVRSFVGQVTAFRDQGLPPGVTIGGYDNFELIDPASKWPLNQLAARMKGKAISTGSKILDLQLLTNRGEPIGQSPGFSWTHPYDPNLLTKVLKSGESLYGNAFRSPAGDERVGLITPIESDEGRIVGALKVELELRPVLGLVLEHEAYGETTESHVAQPTPNGDAQFITLLRFNRDAAFDLVVPQSWNLPINQSLAALGGRLVRAEDYRGEMSVLAIETIPRTGWGLVVKKDLTEAQAPVKQVQKVLLAAGVFAALALFIGWLALMRPLAKRIDNAAKAADRIASGDYSTAIADSRVDEIGEMSRSIDRLARDLSAGNELRAVAEKRLMHQATHDELTQVLNRKQINELISYHLAPRSGVVSSVLFLDLDGFKAINDGFGHSAGDEILKVIARRLSQAAPTGYVARWGGDEFVVLLPGMKAQQAREMSDFVKAMVRVPIVIDGQTHTVRTSIGVASSDARYRPEQVLNVADARMFAQKQSRDARVGVLQATRMIERAIQNNAVEVWFQAIVVPASNPHQEAARRLSGAEALVRIRSESGRYMLPEEFLPQISNAPVMRALEQRICEIAFRTLKQWRDKNMVRSDFKLAINLSAQATNDPEFFSVFNDVRVNSAIPAENIILEISEQANACNRTVLRPYADIGVLIAADDVGIEAANLDRLAWSGISIAKLDKSWLTPAPDDAVSAKVVLLTHLVEICKRLGIDTIAEGVEKTTQKQDLQSLGIGSMQGFHFDKPAPAQTFIRNWANGELQRAS
ncbi:MAG: EAL domain-containing protein [Burkholderiaceae bacterium]